MKLTVWSLNVAFKQVEQWCSKYSEFKIAVNLSAAILYDPNIIQIIKKCLKYVVCRTKQSHIRGYGKFYDAWTLEPEHSLRYP